MTKPANTIRVRAAAGRRVFFPQAVTAGPGRTTRILEGGEVLEVPADMRFIRRSIRCGDLIVVQTDEPPAAAEPEAPTEPDEEQ